MITTRLYRKSIIYIFKNFKNILLITSSIQLYWTSGYAMVVHGRPKTPKSTSFWGSPSPQGSYSPYILGDTTRPRHVTCVLVWSKSDRRRLRKTLHKQTNKQTDRQTNKQTNRHYENNGHLAVNQQLYFWINWLTEWLSAITPSST